MSEDPEALSPALRQGMEERDRPTVIDVVVTHAPAQMLPAVDNRTVEIDGRALDVDLGIHLQVGELELDPEGSRVSEAPAQSPAVVLGRLERLGVPEHQSRMRWLRQGASAFSPQG